MNLETILKINKIEEELIQNYGFICESRIPGEGNSFYKSFDIQIINNYFDKAELEIKREKGSTNFLIFVRLYQEAAQRNSSRLRKFREYFTDYIEDVDKMNVEWLFTEIQQKLDNHEPNLLVFV